MGGGGEGEGPALPVKLPGWKGRASLAVCHKAARQGEDEAQREGAVSPPPPWGTTWALGGESREACLDLCGLGENILRNPAWQQAECVSYPLASRGERHEQ